MLVQLESASIFGVDARPVHIEVHVGKGAQYFMVGLPDNAVRESWKRMETAIRAAGLKMPRQRIVINLAPANQPKQGSSFDLPMAVGILAASGQLSRDAIRQVMLIGELALDGTLRPVPGALALALHAARSSLKEVILPEAMANEACWAEDICIRSARNLKQVVAHLKGEEQLPRIKPQQTAEQEDIPAYGDFAEVSGQFAVKRALEIAAAGGHNILLSGPPGSGKSMLAKRLPGILPPPLLEEALETTKIHSIAGRKIDGSGLVRHRPFRAPHHTCSDVALVGGGSPPLPGEISLAHHGVLYLDEMPEFHRRALEVLRQPIEEGKISISRARYQVEYPARFMLVGAMNPCPCGFYNHPEKECVCSPGQIARYQQKISGPLLDRFDLRINVRPVPIKDIAPDRNNRGEKSAAILVRIINARKLQQDRFVNSKHSINAAMSIKEMAENCRMDKDASKLLDVAASKLNLSGRGYHKVLKVARTIADLEGEAKIGVGHLAEAVGLRE